MNETVEHESPEPGRPRAAVLVEAVLLVSPRPVALTTLLSATALSEEDVRAAIGELQERYSPESSGIVLRRVAGGYQLATNPACAGVLERFRVEARPAPLSGAAYEVLACTLYLGPLTRAGINEVRGVNSDAVVRNLLDRNLLVEAGRDRERPGAPALLDVTEDFLIAAGAENRDAFPALDALVDPEEISRVRERIRGRAGEAGEHPTAAPHGGGE
ncbi:MAG: SMC-Scp complex subunit ScpB [Actinomycetota bacterium]|nr:SMC-Scp complex subunit ScpB [Actinomycetota bacterium]